MIENNFLLLADNIGLKYKFDHKSLNSRQDRWVAFLSEYDIEISHIKGKENIVVDALRRQKHGIHFVLASEYESKFKNLLKTISEVILSIRILWKNVPTDLIIPRIVHIRLIHKDLCSSKTKFMYLISIT